PCIADALVRSTTPSAERHPPAGSAQPGHPWTIPPKQTRVISDERSRITPAGRAEIERILCVHLNLTLKLKALGEAMRDHEFRTNPASRKMAELAIQFHQGFRVDSSFWIGKTEAYIRAVEGAPAAAREILGGDWLESMRRLLEAERRALQKSHEVAAELLRRISVPPQAEA
ncbi:MAG: hypothetical protein L6R30_24730, partial [Thermoanaerobaculia bacterium]|nr:hypothetical protein [Thermoanaerobaculia bacterium]